VFQTLVIYIFVLFKFFMRLILLPLIFVAFCCSQKAFFIFIGLKNAFNLFTNLLLRKKKNILLYLLKSLV